MDNLLARIRHRTLRLYLDTDSLLRISHTQQLALLRACPLP